MKQDNMDFVPKGLELINDYSKAIEENENLKARNKELLKEVESISRNCEKINQHTWETYKEQIQLHLLEIEAIRNNKP